HVGVPPSPFSFPRKCVCAERLNFSRIIKAVHLGQYKNGETTALKLTVKIQADDRFGSMEVVRLCGVGISLG
ncbi:MAG: hypothetical protein ACLP5H_29255, partial [Desulfomonilaceae bacterium]